MKVTVDAVVFAYINKELNVLLIERAFEPYKGMLSLAGGFMLDNETSDESVIRKLKEETNVNLNYLEQLYTFTDLDRDPRERIISIAYYALINPKNQELASNNIHAANVRWYPISELKKLKLAFDHNNIIDYALNRLKNKVVYKPIGFGLLPKQFSMSELFELYCAILGNDLDRRNFIKKINSYGLLKETKFKTEGHVGRRAQLYEFDQKKYERLENIGFIFDI
jgi:8-oxo-dGTP diphosphatase